MVTSTGLLLTVYRPIEDDGPTDADLDEITEGAALIGLSDDEDDINFVDYHQYSIM